MKEIAENLLKIEKIESDMNDKISDVKLEAKDAAEPFKDSIKALEKDMKLFVEEHKDDFGKKKTVTMDFGQVGFRKSTKISLPRAAEKVRTIISKLKELGMGDCVVAPPEKINKEVLKKYSPNMIVEAGAGIEIDDVFWYEPDREKLTDH